MSRLALLAGLTGRDPIRFDLPRLDEERVLVTGSSGFLGQIVTLLIEKRGGTAFPCDLDKGVPVTDPAFGEYVGAIRPTAVIHLAAHKHAPLGEEKPYEVADLNIFGTENVLASLPERDVPITVVLASTCKAADPCTAYGASKLIAERMVLQEPAGVAVRLVNVLDSSGSVLRIWDQLPTDAPLPVVAAARRYWMTPLEAGELLLVALRLDPGLWCGEVGIPSTVGDLAYRYAPDRGVVEIPPRVGDRLEERLLGEYEQLDRVTGPAGVLRILTPWESTEGEHA